VIDDEVVNREFKRLFALIEADETGNYSQIVRVWYADVAAKESPAVADSAYRLMKMTEKVGNVQERKTQIVLTLIGSFFTLLTLVFLMYASLQKGLDDHQMRIIRVIASISAGASGGFISGAALMRATFAKGPLKIVICGAAGCALFFVVFLLFNQL
jgi:hypothetical protein